MRLFCRHCFTTQPVDISIQDCHVQATCRSCGQWIKYLNHKDKQKLLAELIGHPGEDCHAHRTQPQAARV